MIIASAITLTLLQWQPLFDGRTLTGWEQINGTAKFRVEDGAIVGETVVGSPNSFLCTTKMYGDFELEFDVKVDNELNSGVQFRSKSVPGYQSGRVHGYQVEIDPSERGFSGGIYEEGRRGWLQDTSKNEKALKAFKRGEWNKYRVVARGNHLQTWVNGVAAADMKDDLTRWGFIGLQVHSSDKAGLQVRWRNLKIKDHGIPDNSPPKGGKWLLHTESDVKKWQSESNLGQDVGWKFRDGYLETGSGTGNILTRESFGDCKLHVEFMTDDNGLTGQANGNSGVYLMQSYEIQILNSAPRGPLIDECGALYGIKAPDYAMAYRAGQWQTYDIEFFAPVWSGTQKRSNARMTVYHNGTRIHSNVEAPQATGAGAQESPGNRPVRLQDHGNQIRFRNIWVQPIVRNH